MNTVVLRVETELDATAAPRVFGYLGGLGHIPMRAALRRGRGNELVMEVLFEASVPAAQLISSKIGQMPFVLDSRVEGEISGSGSTPQEPAAPSGLSGNVADGGMQHAPMTPAAHPARLDVAALHATAAHRGRAVSYRSQVRLDA